MTKEIDDNLRRAFDTMASEPLPDRFTELLAKLKEVDAGESSKTPERQETVDGE